MGLSDLVGLGTHTAIAEQMTPTSAIKSLGTDAWPRITLVTPVFNSARYLEQTIRSVLYQGYPNLEYIIVDGGSTDGSVELIRKYEKHLSWWISEPDHGMYDALNKGFSKSSGEIMGWISATDQLHVRGLFVVGSVFKAFPDVEWMTGRPTVFDDLGLTVTVCPLQRYSRIRFLAGVNPVIQQESTFWRRNLWERAGGYVDASHRSGSDLELWIRFFHHAKLYPVDALVGGYRGHADALSILASNIERPELIVQTELDSIPWGGALKLFRGINNGIERIPKVRVLWRSIVMKPLGRIPGPDAAPIISKRDNRWVIY